MVGVVTMHSARWLAGAIAVTAAMTVPSMAVPVAHATPNDDALAAAWTATADAPPLYPGVHVDWDVPITMSDGNVIKANVYRPMDAAGRTVEAPLPTIVNITPYTKLLYMLLESAVSIPYLYDTLVTLFNRFDLFNLSGTPLSALGDQIKVLSGGAGRTLAVDRNLIRSGYTQIVADVRGTGFSQGTWQVFGEREKRDTAEIAEWAAHQPWSDGNVGLTGVSNGGISALQGAEQRPASVKAVFATVPEATCCATRWQQAADSTSDSCPSGSSRSTQPNGCPTWPPSRTASSTGNGSQIASRVPLPSSTPCCAR